MSLNLITRGRDKGGNGVCAYLAVDIGNPTQPAAILGWHLYPDESCGQKILEKL